MQATPNCKASSLGGSFNAVLAHVRSESSTCIGAGDFGRVFLIPLLRRGKGVTVKELSLADPSSRCEILIHKYLYERTKEPDGQSTVIPAVYEACQNSDASMDPCRGKDGKEERQSGGVVYALMEFCTAGDLRSLYLRELGAPKRSKKDAAVLVYDTLSQIAKGLVYLQENFRFTHWDLHSENVLVTHDASQQSGYRAMLYDFGFARFEVEKAECNHFECCFNVARGAVLSNALGKKPNREHLPFYDDGPAGARTPTRRHRRPKKVRRLPVNLARTRARAGRKEQQENKRRTKVRRRRRRGLLGGGGGGVDAACARPELYYPFNRGYDFAVLGAYLYYDFVVDRTLLPRAVEAALRNHWIDGKILARTVSDPQLRPSCADTILLRRHDSVGTQTYFERRLLDATQQIR